MSVQFKSSDGTQHNTEFCDRNLNLLAHAQSIELDIGSECGGHGACGRDRVRVPAGARLSPITDEERHQLTEEELRAGWRLACQCFPENSGDEIIITCFLIAP